MSPLSLSREERKMEARKVAYVIALVAVELLAPNNAEAGGVSEYMEPVNNSQTVTISQEEYKQLIHDQTMLHLYESGERASGSAVTLTEANEIVEKALGKVDSLQIENERLKALLEASPEQIEVEVPVAPEISFMQPMYTVGGGLIVGDGSFGLYVDGEYRFTPRLGVSAMLLWLGGPAIGAGVRYHL